MAKSILVFGEVRNGALKPITRELVTAATELSAAGGGPVVLALIGEGADQAVADAKSLPVTRVYTATHALLSAYSSQGYAVALAAIVEAAEASVVLFGATSMGRDLAVRAQRPVAARRCFRTAPSWVSPTAPCA